MNASIEFTRDLAGDALKGFVSDLMRGKSAAEALSGVLDQIASKLAEEAIDGLIDGSFKSGGGTNILGSLFGRASGGHVNAGRAYRVGERGPETFVPMTTGRIIPAARGGTSISVPISIDARGATADAIAGLQARVEGLKRQLPSIIMRTQNEALRRGASR